MTVPCSSQELPLFGHKSNAWITSSTCRLCTASMSMFTLFSKLFRLLYLRVLYLVKVDGDKWNRYGMLLALRALTKLKLHAD
jgi:hypothetical protein